MWQIIQGDARRIPLGDETVQCVVTSPPYWGLRDYGLPPSVWGGEEHEHEWGDNTLAGEGYSSGQRVRWQHTGGRELMPEGGFQKSTHQGQFCPCGAWLGVLGLEPTPELYIKHIVQIFREVRRVLRKDGTVWLNLGDSYATSGHSSKDGDIKSDHLTGGGLRSWGEHRQAVKPTIGNGLKPKDLCGIPWRAALALQADGWWLRSDIIWSKPNPMPESVTDRPTRSHEYVFLLTKAASYYYDADAMREPHTEPWRGVNHHESHNPHSGRLDGGEQAAFTVSRREYNPAGRNLRSVWNIPTQPFPEAHFATFPQALVEPCIKAGTSEKGCCAECGSPWERVVESNYYSSTYGDSRKPDVVGSNDQKKGAQEGLYFSERKRKESTTLGWRPTCNHGAWLDGPGNKFAGLPDPVPCLVLDPFAGSGTVGVVCIKLNRSFVGIELKAEYTEMANKRVFNSGSLLAI